MTEFTSNELDKIEDALELIESTHNDLKLPLKERLEEYRTVMRTVDKAWPLEDPGSGVLDAIMTSVGQVEAEPESVLVSTNPDEDPKSIFDRFRRWRKIWMPAVATVAVTSLIFVVVEDNPDPAPGAGDVDVSQTRNSDSKTAASVLDSDAKLALKQDIALRERDGDAAPLPEATKSKIPAEETEMPIRDEMQSGGVPGGIVGGVNRESMGLERLESITRSKRAEPKARKPKTTPHRSVGKPKTRAKKSRLPVSAPAQPSKKKSKSNSTPFDDMSVPDAGVSKTQASSAPHSKEKSGKEEVDKTSSASVNETLSQGHRSRRNGDCKTAKARYRVVMKSGTSKSHEAEAGLSLCFEFQGNTKLAQHHYNRAIQANSSLKAWVEAERSRRNQK